MRLIPHSGRRLIGLAMTLATLSIATVMQAAPPAPVITTPAAAPNNVYNKFPVVEITASGENLSSVQVLLRRLLLTPRTDGITHEFWDGGEWVPSRVKREYFMPATPPDPDRRNCSACWTRNFNVNQLSFRDGRYEVLALASDPTGESFSRYKPFLLDKTAPQVRVISPNKPSYSLLHKARFYATDNLSGVKQVLGVVRRTVRISTAPGYRYEYWTGGDTWTTDARSSTVLQPTTKEEAESTVYELDLPTLASVRGGFPPWWGLPIAVAIGAYAYDFADDPATAKQENQGKTQVPVPNTNPQRFDFWTHFRLTGLNIRGRITNAGGGVAGVEVFAAPSASVLLASVQGVATLPKATTMADGTFLIRGLVPGSYFVAPVQKGTFFNNATNLPLTPVQLGNSTVSNVNFTIGGTDSTEPTAEITSHRPQNRFEDYTTTVSGTANDTGGAKLLGVAVALARLEAMGISGFFNFTTGQFDAITDPAQLTPNHIKIAEPIMPDTPFNWTVSGLPTLPRGNYGLLPVTADSAGNVGRQQMASFMIQAE